MDTLTKRNLNEDCPDLTEQTQWTDQTKETQLDLENSQTMLYIAVGYVKDDTVLSETAMSFNSLDAHVSSLDPNMSSVARYSPVYNQNEHPNEFTPVIQLVSQPEESQCAEETTTLETISTVLNSNTTQYLHMVDNETLRPDSEEFQLVNNEKHQRLELLITDQTTGISYSVNTQDLDDEQLLSVLNPEPLLDTTDLLQQLDDSALKGEISDANLVQSYINCVEQDDSYKQLNTGTYKVDNRRQKSGNVSNEEQLLSCVYTITDKPVPSRARATLPESYLAINKINETVGVFAKKAIPMRTQFGPLEGAFHEINRSGVTTNSDAIQYIFEMDNYLYRIDVSDESQSNWMCFVRKADTYEEMNLVISQETDGLYFTTTKQILPKHELKVGYGLSYSKLYNFTILEPKLVKSWPCYECDEKFINSNELQLHLNVHDNEIPNIKRKLQLQVKNKKQTSDILECNLCKTLFMDYTYFTLRKHLREQHRLIGNITIDEKYSIVACYRCNVCESAFRSDALLRIHQLEHGSGDCNDTDEEHIVNHICPACQRKYPTQRQLVLHVQQQHALPKRVKKMKSSANANCIKCPVCYKMFAFRDRLQKHMLVHGSDDLKPLECKTCKKRFLNKSALTCHVKTHYVGRKVFECPICLETFDHVLKLKLHVTQHSLNNQYTCPHCQKVFKKYSVIRKHIRAFHCERKHKCEHCTKMFPTLDKLRMHLLRHSDHREFLCSDCGKQFKRKDKLTEHCKRMHMGEEENTVPPSPIKSNANNHQAKKYAPKTSATDFHRFIYKCHTCLVGFKRRGMLVNHLAKRHPDIQPDSVPELNLPILQTIRDYYCQYCDKVYKSSSKLKAHIVKNHPGAALPMSNRTMKQQQLEKGGKDVKQEQAATNPIFSQTVGSITTRPQNCKWCFKQYASKAKLLQHQRKKHAEQLHSLTLQNKNRNQEKNKIGSNGKEEAFVEKGHNIEMDTLFSGNKMIDEINLIDDLNVVSLNEASDGVDGGLNELIGNSNSHLYRLLTTASNDMLPPPR